MRSTRSIALAIALAATPVAAVTAHPVMERAWEMTRAHAARAKQILAPLPDSAVKDALAGFADYVVDRSS